MKKTFMSTVHCLTKSNIKSPLVFAFGNFVSDSKIEFSGLQHEWINPGKRRVQIKFILLCSKMLNLKLKTISIMFKQLALRSEVKYSYIYIFLFTIAYDSFSLYETSTYSQLFSREFQDTRWRDMKSQTFFTKQIAVSYLSPTYTHQADGQIARLQTDGQIARLLLIKKQGCV